jgi:hypothetical protein
MNEINESSMHAWARKSATTTVITPLKKEETSDDDTDFDSSDVRYDRIHK